MSKIDEYKQGLAQAESLLRQSETQLEYYQSMKRAARPNPTGRIANSAREARLQVAQYNAAVQMAKSKISILKKQIKKRKSGDSYEK